MYVNCKWKKMFASAYSMRQRCQMWIVVVGMKNAELKINQLAWKTMKEKKMEHKLF